MSSAREAEEAKRKLNSRLQEKHSSLWATDIQQKGNYMVLQESSFFRARKKALIAAGIFYIVLLGIWAFLELYLTTNFLRNVPERIYDIIKEIGLKLIAWFLPALVISRKFDSSMYVDKSEMFSVKKKDLLYLLILLPFMMFHAVLSIRSKGGIVINSSFSVLDVLIFASVGLCEEMVFRGVLLNVTLREKKNNIAAIAVNAVLFLIIHFPIWYRTGALADNLLSGSFITVIILSIIFSYVFSKTKGIVIPAALHMCWDILCVMQ